MVDLFLQQQKQVVSIQKPSKIMLNKIMLNVERMQ